ncbi:hypothetical protein CVIRNUC_006429 [Coccomyxa viridis]|uniref:Uncharacterized protein n=1 Tax=Coccomyxa viridis TaxID=1274662 RepID=A0AAV1IB53_9CHLO|nr:hypothetical protein CVIRNUC_006429 [Coccomyxa viridis]
MKAQGLLTLVYVAAVLAYAAADRDGGNDGGHYGGGDKGRGNGHSWGRGDPIMTGFGGRAFEFLGQPGKIYSLLSEKHHQVSTKLKVGVMWDHNGTYMEGFGFQYRDQQILVELNRMDELEVTMNGERLAMTKGETELEMIPYVEGGELLMLWQLHREGLGKAVEITTDLMQVLIWLTPAGTVDDGGKEQPAYLNFDVSLLGPPSGNHMEGVVGETYNRMLVGEAANDPNSEFYLPDDYVFRGKGAEFDYLIASYFSETANTMFGKEHKRVLIEADAGGLQFPMRALGRAAGLLIAPKPLVVRASGGRRGRFL